MGKLETKPLLHAALAALAALTVAAILAWQYERNQHLQAQRIAALAADEYCQRLHERLDFSLSAAYALAAVVRQGQGKVQNFDALAQQMLKVYGGGINSLGLAPGGIISQIVPLQGHEAALGHDLLKDPRRTKEAFLAVQTRQLTLAGPFNLMQGGIGVVGRLPVYLTDAQGQDSFWGFTTVLMRVPDLLEKTHIKELGEKGYRYELWRIHPDSGLRQVIARHDDLPLVDPVSNTIDVPNGRWTLSLSPLSGWQSLQSQLLVSTAVLAFGLLAGFLAYHLARLPQLLKQKVESQTRELAEANQRLELEVRKKAQAEEALHKQQRELEAAVRLRTAELSALSAHIEQVREEEKAAIARDLHDEFGGILTALKMGISRIDEQCQVAVPQCQSKLRELRDMIDASIVVMRRILDNLRPSILDHLGIGAAIHWQAREFTRHGGTPCEVVLFDDELKLSSSLSITLFRVLQEALTNVSRHAQASRVTVSLSQSQNGRDITLEVSDNGRGMDYAQSMAAVSHGLRGMRERAKRMGGELNIRSETGKGTTIELTLPLPQTAEA